MPEHSIEHSSENSTRRQAEHSPRYKTKAFAARRKHSIRKKDEEEEEIWKEGSEEEEEENGGDTDRKYAMRVENHHPLPSGAIDLTSTQKLFHQWLLNQSESDKATGYRPVPTLNCGASYITVNRAKGSFK